MTFVQSYLCFIFIPWRASRESFGDARMAVPFSNTKLRVPNGFRSLLWVLSKEVIRDAPADVVTYCVEFMGKLLQIRADSGHDPAVDGARSEDFYYNKYVFIKRQADAEATETASQPPQEQPGQSSAQPDQPVQTMSAPEEEGAKTSGEDDKMAASGGQHRQDNDSDIDLSDPEMETAATKIQALFRGHLIRRNTR